MMRRERRCKCPKCADVEVWLQVREGCKVREDTENWRSVQAYVGVCVLCTMKKSSNVVPSAEAGPYRWEK